MLLSTALGDTVSFVLEYLSQPKDLTNVDQTCSQLRKINENTGWKTFSINVFGFPESYKEKAGNNLTWKSFLSTRVKPIFQRLSHICSINALKEKARNIVGNSYFQEYNPEAYKEYVQTLKDDVYPPKTEKCREVLNQQDWPIDIAIFIACHCYLSQAPLNKQSYFDFGYLSEESTESFAFWDSFALGGGDTNWWSYVVLKGTVKVPLAPKNYSKKRDRGDPVEIGRGGIVAFSHWNHGWNNTTARHIHPDWDPTEFGIDKNEYEEVCDGWVRANLEEPVQASVDSLPAAWKDIFHFMDELEFLNK